jgi:hypothetical protein
MYSKRFRIETFFSDQKSRGFHLHQSHLADPQRLSRLLIAACLAYIWIIYLGSVCIKDGLVSTIHRGDRCDLSLFQLGLRLLDKFLNEDLPHSTELRGEVCHRSAKASGGEDLQVEKPVSCWDCASFYLHATVAGMLGPTLIRDEVV